VNGLQFFLLTKPQLNNTASADTAKVVDGKFVFNDGETVLNAYVSTGFTKMSVGFSGYSDGYQDLAQNFIMDYAFNSATNGSVASMGQ